MTYRPHQTIQGDGDPTQWSDCGPSIAVDMIERDWLGVRRPTNDAIRAFIGGSAGTNGTQLAAAARAISATILEPHPDVPWAIAYAALKGGRGVGFVTRHSVYHGTKYDASPYFDGLHWIYANELRTSATGVPEVLVYDPMADHRAPYIPMGPFWQPMSLLQRAALAVMNDGSVDVLFTRNTTGLIKRALYSGGALRAAPRVDSRRVDNLDLGSLVTVAATISAGGEWTVNDKTGRAWYRLSKIDGHALASALYVARGWFQGPTGAVG